MLKHTHSVNIVKTPVKFQKDGLKTWRRCKDKVLLRHESRNKEQSIANKARVVLGQTYHGLTGGFLLLRIFSAGISVSCHMCFILDLILISMFL